jgi:hypothetical protein
VVETLVRDRSPKKQGAITPGIERCQANFLSSGGDSEYPLWEDRRLL